tara:strand:- start:7079 stop:8431 length:1353 start_codon:yes stop_codon:yes gene_type:complete
MSKISTIDQEILKGSSKLFSEKKKTGFDRTNYMVKNMEYNHAFIQLSKGEKDKDKILYKLQEEYKSYRKKWVNILDSYKIDSNFKPGSKISPPLSVDIETASICDLACPHCSREYIITPDKIMNFELYKKIISECKKLKVPSIKLNWRGEPLLNPKINEFVKYAKDQGILEVSINTNAVSLTEEKAEKLINSGLDVIIFSFDGGTKKTYEKLRPGRFHKNNFEQVYGNIKRFTQIKKKLNSKFPITKIQMILTKDSREETNNFFEIFGDIIDDVTVTQYNERGGSVKDLTDAQQIKLTNYLTKNNLNSSTPYMVNFEGEIFISKKRKACEQIFQRLMLTYNGRAGMCCHDWGAQHGVGFIDKDAYESDDKEFLKVKQKIETNKKGFELLKEAKIPNKFNEPDTKVQNIEEIWNGEELNRVRKIHRNNNLNDLKVCEGCTFKDTYHWEKII